MSTRSASGGRLRPDALSLSSLASLAAAALDGWSERAQGRRRLAALDDRMLADIGISRADAEREASKPFWRA